MLDTILIYLCLLFVITVIGVAVRDFICIDKPSWLIATVFTVVMLPVVVFDYLKGKWHGRK